MRMVLPVCVFVTVWMTFAVVATIAGGWPGLLFILFGSSLTGLAFGSEAKIAERLLQDILKVGAPSPP